MNSNDKTFAFSPKLLMVANLKMSQVRLGQYAHWFRVIDDYLSGIIWFEGAKNISNAGFSYNGTSYEFQICVTIKEKTCFWYSKPYTTDNIDSEYYITSQQNFKDSVYIYIRMG